VDSLEERFPRSSLPWIAQGARMSHKYLA
jgi:hypothetical protein